MSRLYESRKDCDYVAAFMWDNTAISYGEFEGIYKLSSSQLFELKGLVEAQLFISRNEEFAQ